MASQNFTGKLTQDVKERYTVYPKGTDVFINVSEKGEVVVFRPFKNNVPVLDLIFDSIEEAAKICTCVSRTSKDVRAMFDEAISRRYSF